MLDIYRKGYILCVLKLQIIAKCSGLYFSEKKDSTMKYFLTLFILSFISQPFFAQKGLYRLLVGTYTNTGKSEGIYAFDVNVKTATFTQKSVATGIINPSYLTLTPDAKFLYAVSEDGKNSVVNAFSFNKNTFEMMFLNRSPAKGLDPCYISVTKKHVFTANYSSGNVSVLGRKSDGTLTEVLQQILLSGKSINTERQNEPHVHQVLFSLDKKYLIINDLGTDHVNVYTYKSNAITEILTPWDTLAVKPGSGPRHAVFSKNGKRLYLLQELDGTVSVLKMQKGKLNLIQETTVMRKENKKAGAADIHLSPDGKFLYATNRAPENTITCFSVAKNGRLEFRQQVSSGGSGPRNFALTADGQYLFVGNQYSDAIDIFKRNIKTGFLTNTGKKIIVGAPVCLAFF